MCESIQANKLSIDYITVKLKVDRLTDHNKNDEQTDHTVQE
jgi:hypothetical protein